MEYTLNMLLFRMKRRYLFILAEGEVALAAGGGHAFDDDAAAGLLGYLDDILGL